MAALRGKGLAGYKLVEGEGTWTTLLRAVAAEFLGTLLFVLLATGVVTSGCHTPDVASASGNGGDLSLTKAPPGNCFLQSTTVLNIAMGFGFMLFVVIYLTAPFSGGNINPAVSVALFLTRKISLLKAVLYIIFQCGGAAVGSVILKGLDPAGYRTALGAANQLNSQIGVTLVRAWGFETALTFALVYTVFVATDTARGANTPPLPILAPLSIGIVVFVCHLVLVPIDGCSVNPARSFGPAAVAHAWHNHWIFWVGPIAGAVLASLVYELCFNYGDVPLASDSAAVEGGFPAKGKDTHTVVVVPESDAAAVREHIPPALLNSDVLSSNSNLLPNQAYTAQPSDVESNLPPLRSSQAVRRPLTPVQYEANATQTIEPVKRSRRNGGAAL